MREYERLQKACAALFENSARQAPSSARLIRSLRRVESRLEQGQSERSYRVWAVWGVAGGLAACLLVVGARVSLPASLVAVSESDLPELAIPASGPKPSLSITADDRSGGFASTGRSGDWASHTGDATAKWTLAESEIPAYAMEEIAAMNREVQLSKRQQSLSLGNPAQDGLFSRQMGSIGASGVAPSFSAEAVSYRFER